MPILNEFTFRSSNCKNDIYVREWLPEGAPLGVVQICHGVAEHIDRYDDFAIFLASNGYVVSGNDHLGHGKSIMTEEQRGFFGENGGWELVTGDVRKLNEQLRARYPRLPFFIFGHSMGSFIARTYIIRYHDDLSGVILSGTGQQLAPVVSAGITLSKAEIRRKGASYISPLVHKAAFGAYNRKIKNVQTEWDWITNDRDALQKYIDDPDCGFMATAGLYRDMFTAIKYVSQPKNIQRVNKNLPMLLVSGTADPVGDYGKGVVRAYNGYMNAGLSDVTLKLYNGGRHELVNDFCRNEVYADVLDWLSRKTIKTDNQ